MAEKHKNLLLFGNGVSESLLEELPGHVQGADIVPVSSAHFPAGAEFVELFPFDKKNYQANSESLKDSVVTIVQSTPPSCAENLMFTLMAVKNFKQAGVKQVHVIFPFVEYMRQEKPDKNRFTSVANELIPELLATAGADHITLVTPHSKEGIDQYRKIFGRNLEVVKASDLFIQHIKKQFAGHLDDLVIGAPDGMNKPNDQATQRAITVAKELFGEENYEKHLFGIEKKRTGPGKSEIVGFQGDVKGKTAIVIDDMIDGGGTMIEAAKKLKDEGASQVHVGAIHGLFSKTLAPLLSARDNDDNFLISSILVSDSLPIERSMREARFQFPKLNERINIIHTSPLIGEAIEKNISNSAQIARDAKHIPRINGQQVAR